MSDRPRVWVTRAEPGCAATAERLRALGFAPLVAPLLTVRAIEADLALTGVAALAFTSTNGVRAFAAQDARRDLPVFTVGDATAEAARREGFTDVRSADGDVGDLGRLIAKARPAGSILAPGGVERAGDLVGSLRGHGMEVVEATLYDTPAVDALPSKAAAALAAREVGAVLLHSPRAAAILAALAGGFDLSAVIALGLSSPCLTPLRSLGFARQVRAERPREDALLDALFVALGNRAPRR